MSEALMNCQNCDAPVLASDERCEKCGAKLLRRRAFLGSSKAEEFTLTPEEPPSELEERTRDEEWRFPSPAEFPAAAPIVVEESSSAPRITYGGFWRRLSAFIVDFIVIFLLSMIMTIMAYVGYKVGLRAHQRNLSFSNAAPLVAFLTSACVFLASVYFVLFHGMDGRTIGKWLFGLRVVGEGQSPINYRRALLRWIGTVGFGCLSIGLSFLWILWSGEKRGWHDFLARTWVIRE
jgi:uncharacterized RDD family membrane protein YckC